jgi:hypothetical protein
MFVYMIKPITDLINKCLTCNVFYMINPVTDLISKCLNYNIFNLHIKHITDSINKCLTCKVFLVVCKIKFLTDSIDFQFLICKNINK